MTILGMVLLDGCSVFFSQALLICLADIKPTGEETEWQQQVCRKDFLSMTFTRCFYSL